MFFIIFGLISIILVVYIAIKNKSIGSGVWMLLVMLLIGFLAYIIISFIATPFQIKQSRIDKSYPIQGIELKSETTTQGDGTFILGCGSYSETTKTFNKYYFFKNTENGKILQSVPIEHTYIKETNEELPKCDEIISYYTNNKFFHWLIGNCNIRANEPVEYRLVVPEGTIKIDYNIDI